MTEQIFDHYRLLFLNEVEKVSLSSNLNSLKTVKSIVCLFTIIEKIDELYSILTKFIISKFEAAFKTSFDYSLYEYIKIRYNFVKRTLLLYDNIYFSMFPKSNLDYIITRNIIIILNEQLSTIENIEYEELLISASFLCEFDNLFALRFARNDIPVFGLLEPHLEKFQTRWKSLFSNTKISIDTIDDMHENRKFILHLSELLDKYLLEKEKLPSSFETYHQNLNRFFSSHLGKIINKLLEIYSKPRISTSVKYLCKILNLCLFIQNKTTNFPSLDIGAQLEVLISNIFSQICSFILDDYKDSFLGMLIIRRRDNYNNIFDQSFCVQSIIQTLNKKFISSIMDELVEEKSKSRLLNLLFYNFFTLLKSSIKSSQHFNELLAEQVLLDYQELKMFFLSLNSTPDNECIKVLEEIEILLKSLLCPVFPPSLFIANFFNLFGNNSNLDELNQLIKILGINNNDPKYNLIISYYEKFIKERT